jgi:hypothetical protein
VKSRKNFVAAIMQEGEPVGNWEKTLELLRRQGWEYTYGKFIDLEAQEEFYWVSINRGDQDLSSLWPTLEEAAVNLNRFLAAASS